MPRGALLVFLAYAAVGAAALAAPKSKLAAAVTALEGGVDAAAPKEAGIAARAVPLPVSDDAAADMAARGVVKIAGAVDAAACAALRAYVRDWLAAGETDSPAGGRFVPRTRLSLGAPQRLSFAGARSDLLLNPDEARARAVAAAAVSAVLPAAEACAPAAIGSGPLEIVELGALTASAGATHQAQHSDYAPGGVLDVGVPPRFVCFVALQSVPSADQGATVFAARDGEVYASTPLEAGDVILYDASTPHFGHRKTIATPGGDPRILLYVSLAPRGDEASLAAAAEAEAAAMGARWVAAPRYDARAYAAAGALLESGGLEYVDASAARVAADGLGGYGVYAARDLKRGEALARLPLADILGADAACEALGARAAALLRAADGDGAAGAARATLVAAALARAYATEDGRFAKWRPYARTLPWGDGDPARDSLADHPALVATAGGPPPADDQLAKVVADLRTSAETVAILADCEVGVARRAVLLVLTRAFSLTHLRDDLDVAMVPFVDLFNHPSVAAMRAQPAMLDVPIAEACVEWSTVEDGDLVVRAPRGVDVGVGEQIFNWYANAGFGVTESIEARRAAENAFLYQYGFSPWS